MYIYGIISPTRGKEERKVGTEAERQDTKKATVYDLQKILEKDPHKTYTVEEIKALMDAYISGQN